MAGIGDKEYTAGTREAWVRDNELGANQLYVGRRPRARLLRADRRVAGKHTRHRDEQPCRDVVDKGLVMAGVARC